MPLRRRRCGVTAWPGEGQVYITIADAGGGLPSGELERIFDKFHRAGEVRRPRPAPALGLPICRGFVEALGGKINAAQSAWRRGDFHHHPADSGESRMSATPPHVLVVDDEGGDPAFSFASASRPQNFLVSEAATGNRSTG